MNWDGVGGVEGVGGWGEGTAHMHKKTPPKKHVGFVTEGREVGVR